MAIKFIIKNGKEIQKHFEKLKEQLIPRSITTTSVFGKI